MKYHQKVTTLLLYLVTLVIIHCFVVPAPDGAADTATTLATESSGTETAGEASAIAPLTAESKKKLPEVLQKTRPNIRWSMSVGKLIWAGIFIFIAFYIIKYATRMLETMAERWVKLRLTVMRIIPFIRLTGWACVIYFIIVAVLGPPIETILALTASAGIALGFASQDILKNIFGGLLILVDRPFQIGDKIKIRDHYGEVVQIGLRSVRIVTPDDSIVSLPNSDIVSQSVANANNGESNCQVITEIYLPCDLDLQQLKKSAYRAASVSRYIYLNKPVSVVFKNEIHDGRSILKMKIKAYVLDIRYEFAFTSDITELVIEDLLKKGLIKQDELSQPSFPERII